MTQLITNEKAKEILGERGKKMTDKDIEQLLNMLRFLCNKTIDSVVGVNQLQQSL